MEIEDGDIIDVDENCYIVETTGGERYKLPPGIGEIIEIRNGQLIQIKENHFIRLIIPEDTEIGEATDNILESYTPCSSQNVDESNSNQQANNAVPTSYSIWKSSRNQTETDVAATTKLLDLRSSEKYEKLFADKKTVKLKV